MSTFIIITIKRQNNYYKKYCIRLLRYMKTENDFYNSIKVKKW